jgi:signal peptidase II
MKRRGLLVIPFALAVDQMTKAWALVALSPAYGEGITVLPILRLRLGFNTGVSFGMFSESAADAVWLLVGVKLAIIAVLIGWLGRTRSGTEALGIGLVIGGALGNLIDRVHLGAVVDFLDAHYAGWHWPTFNVADVAIVLGVLLIFLVGLRAQPAPPAP